MDVMSAGRQVELAWARFGFAARRPTSPAPCRCHACRCLGHRLALPFVRQVLVARVAAKPNCRIFMPEAAGRAQRGDIRRDEAQVLGTMGSWPRAASMAWNSGRPGPLHPPALGGVRGCWREFRSNCEAAEMVDTETSAWSSARRTRANPPGEAFGRHAVPAVSGLPQRWPGDGHGVVRQAAGHHGGVALLVQRSEGQAGQRSAAL